MTNPQDPVLLTAEMVSDLADLLLVYRPEQAASPMVDRYWGSVVAALRSIASGAVVCVPVDGLKAYSESIKRIAFEMPPPNPYTPRFVQLAQSLTAYVHALATTTNGNKERT